MANLPRDATVLSIDAGTESIRAAVVDLSGRILGTGRSPLTTYYPAPGRSEQDPSEWESSLWKAIGQALAGVGDSARKICGIAADGTASTVVCLDAEGRHLGNALLWSDVRAGEEAAIIGASGDPALKRAGGGTPSAEWFLCKALWIKRNKPYIWENASVVFELTDWLSWKLTGRFSLSMNAAVMRGFHGGLKGGHPFGIFSGAGLDDLPGKLPARIVLPGEKIGGLNAEASSRTGLPAGLPVAGCGADAFIGTIGLDALEPGRVALITGSSHVITAHTESEIHAKGLFGAFPDALYPGSFLLEGGLASTGSVLRWFTEGFIGESARAAARAQGKSLLSYLDSLAAEILPGAEGITVIEHWQGSRCPWIDPDSRGVIRGLSLRHGPAHIYRAIMEAVAMGTRLNLERMEAAGVPVDELRACGGASKSPLWMQIHADVTGKPIRLPIEPESVLLGAAMLATIGAGIHGSVPEAAAAMARQGGTVIPDMAAHAAYTGLAKRYAPTYEAIRPLAKIETEKDKR
jgi:ribulokinase